MNVRDLLELQRSLHRDRVMHAPAEEQGVLAAREFRRPGGHLGLDAQGVGDHAGRRRSASSSSTSFSLVNRFLCFARTIASTKSAASCAVKALVEATPISGPARVRNRSLQALMSADSGTLQMASAFGWPSARAWCRAAMVSAVSPDCEITTTSERPFGTDSR